MMCLCALDVCTDWASGGGRGKKERKGGGVPGCRGGNARGAGSGVSDFEVFVVVEGTGGWGAGLRIRARLSTLVPGSGLEGCWGV